MILSLEKLVTTLDTSRKMKELGFPQGTEFYWVKYPDGTWKVIQGNPFIEYKCKRVEQWKEWYAAYLSSEVGEILPHLSINSQKVSKDGLYLCTLDKSIVSVDHKETAITESEARGLMAIWLKEQGLI